MLMNTPSFHHRRELLRTGLAAGLGTALTANPAGSALAQTSGNPVRMLLGYPAGGAVDVAARALAQALQGPLGQTLVVENRPGASGMLPMDPLKQAPADGTTLLFTPPDVPVIFPHVMSNLRYDPAKDLIPVARVLSFSFGFGSGAATPAKTLGEFLEWSKANPNKANYGTPGIGSSMHFLGEALSAASGVRLEHVPYKGGAQAIVDVVGGQLASLITTSPILVPQHRAGKIRVLAVTASKRLASLPEVQTVREAGFPGLEEEAWFGVFVRSGTPAETVNRLSQAIGQAVASEPFTQAMRKIDFEPEFAGPQAFSQIVAQGSAKWAERARTTGFRADR
jgi:tripartite-type tricarboxylate transporter receptor subunit TctC